MGFPDELPNFQGSCSRELFPPILQPSVNQLPGRASPSPVHHVSPVQEVTACTSTQRGNKRARGGRVITNNLAPHMEALKAATKLNSGSIVRVAESVDRMADSIDRMATSSERVSQNFENMATALGNLASVIGNCFKK